MFRVKTEAATSPTCRTQMDDVSSSDVDGPVVKLPVGDLDQVSGLHTALR